MVNEYLQQKNLEYSRRFQQTTKSSALEKMVDRGIQPVRLREALLHAPEVREHAITCKSFDIERVHFSLPDQESQLSFQQQSSLPIDIPQDQSVSQSHSQPVQQHSASDQNIYGTGRGVPMTCSCGQTITATLGQQESSYLSPSVSPARSSYGTPSQQTTPLYGNSDSSRSRSGQRSYA